MDFLHLHTHGRLIINRPHSRLHDQEANTVTRNLISETGQERDTRLRFMRIYNETGALLREFWKLVEPALPTLLNGFYHHVTSEAHLARTDLAAHLFSIKRIEEATHEGIAAAARLTDLLATAGDAIICIDSQHKIVTFNAEAERIFGYTSDAIIGRPLDILLPEIARDRHYAHVQSFAASAEARRLMSDRSEIRGRRKDGSEFFAEAAISKLQTSDGMLFTAVLRDVTQRRQAEEMLRAAVRSADAANAAKSEFLANMSHELRTPLNAIMGFSELMENDHLGSVAPAKCREYAHDIYVSGEHLLRVINDVLDLAKAEAGRIVLHEEIVDLKEIATACLHMVWPKADQGAVAVHLKIDDGVPGLLADRAKVQQMLLNLLSNAVKFASPGGKVTMTAFMDHAGRAVLSVQDDGIGMTPEQVPIALEPFRQIDNQLNRKYEGTGLGLPITKRLAELHGGELEITSAQGQGTTAMIAFPARRVVFRISDQTDAGAMRHNGTLPAVSASVERP